MSLIKIFFNLIYLEPLSLQDFGCFHFLKTKQEAAVGHGGAQTVWGQREA